MHVLYYLCLFFSLAQSLLDYHIFLKTDGRGGVRLWSSEDDISKNHWN